MAFERTLVLVKPDGMQRRLAGLIIDRLEATGLEMAAAKVVSVTDELARKHYALLEGKGYFSKPENFEALISFIKGELHNVTHHRVIAMVYQGENAVKTVRATVGDTNPEKAAGGTIRGSFGRITTKNVFENVIHASGTSEEGEREISVWFKPEEVIGR